MENSNLYIPSDLAIKKENINLICKEYQTQANKVWSGVVVDYVEMAAKKSEELNENAIANYIRSL